MPKLIISADIHGSYNSWLTLRALLNKNDALVIAGDLFDTKYGSHGDPDFAPEHIKKDLDALSNPFFYVYGNCDIPSFCPGFDFVKKFCFYHHKIQLHHGHQGIGVDPAFDIIIQGHTHKASLTRNKGVLCMNPGSITRPRNKVFTYGIIKKDIAVLIELSTGKTLQQLKL